MPYEQLSRILETEGTSFQALDKRWRPTDLLFIRQVQVLLQDMSWRHARLTEALGEIKTLDRASVYTKLFHRMRLQLRKANFTWKSDQMSFIGAMSSFYEDYGAVLRLLKIDEARGRLKTDPPAVKQGV